MSKTVNNPVLAAARSYRARGYVPVPIPARTKRPVINGWQRLRLADAELPLYFNGVGNIGLVLGDGGGGLGDLDLDSNDAMELADTYLPATPAVTGRPSKPRSHRWYIAGGLAYKKFCDPVSGETLFEVRGAGHQTVVGPSIHPSGEPYDALEGEPTRVETAELWRCAWELYRAIVRKRHPGLAGYEPGQGAPTISVSSSTPAPSSHASASDKVLARASAYLDRIPHAISGSGGHDQTYAAAVAMVHGFGLSEEQGLKLLITRYNPRCQPPWSERELLHKVSDAATKPHDKPRGWLHDVDLSPMAPGVDLSQFNPDRRAVQSNAPDDSPGTGPGGAAAAAVGGIGDRNGVGDDDGDDDDDDGDDDDESQLGPRPGGGAVRPPTDLGNAERLAAKFRDRLRYCHATGRWLVWDGTRWKEDDSGAPHRAAAQVAREILDEARRQYSKKLRKKLGAWAFRSEDRSRIEAMVALARSQESLVVKVEDLDRDPWLFNVKNGTIDLRTGELRPHRREDMITRAAPVVYDATASCPLCDKFLNRIFGGDEALVRFVLRYLAMSLTGDVTEQLLPIFYGLGNNGKNVLLDTVAGIMGEYATTAPPSLLTLSKNSEHPTEIADLRGRRLVVASETEDGAVLKLQLVKRLTGDKRLKGRFMRQDYFEFERTHKMVMLTNNRPRVNEDSEAVWRRLRLVPFNVVIPPKERDPQLMSRLEAEWPGILALLVRSCVEWQREGLGTPTAVMGATAAYRASEDALGQYLVERCDVDDADDRSRSKMFVPWAFLFDDYTAWAGRSGFTPLDARELQDALDKRGFPTTTQKFMGKATKGRLGLMLKAAGEARP